MNLILQTLSSPLLSEIVMDSILDGVILDKEHGVFDNSQLVSCIQTVKLMNKKCFVRVTDLDRQLVRMCLDNGVDGIIFSTIESIDQSKKNISFCKYPKHGGSRGQALVRENRWGKLPLGDSSPLIIAQIETKKGVDNLEEIYNSGYDYFIIGPYDLSASLGCVGEWNNKKYLTYYEKIIGRIPISQLGIFLPKQEDIQHFLNTHNGPRPEIIIWGMDAMFLSEKIKSLEGII